MANNYFNFKQFRIDQSETAMKVGTDGVLLGAWARLKDEQNDEAAAMHTAPRILDIGTGTGLIALIAAQRCPRAVIDAVEIDRQAARQAQRNVQNSPWPDRIRIYNSAIQDLTSPDRPYDHILSNPPFFAGSLKASDACRSAARHNDTLPFADLAAAAGRLLALNGRFSVIYPTEEAAEFQRIATEHNLYLNRRMQVRSTLQGAVKRVLMEFSRVEMPVDGQRLAIQTAPMQYTGEYIHLTRDFYLKF